MNPFQVIQAMKNPKNFILNSMGNNTNPMVKKLVEMANKGDTKGVENFARNMMKEQGKDFDKEFSNFMSSFK